MIEVLIKSVSPLAEYDGVIYSYIVDCILNNGREISFVDEKPFDMTNLSGKKARVKLTTAFLSDTNDCNYLFEGTIEYLNLSDEYYFIGEEISVLLSKQIVEWKSVKINEKKKYCFEEFILKDFAESHT